jgi:hypothetical protein
MVVGFTTRYNNGILAISGKSLISLYFCLFVFLVGWISVRVIDACIFSFNNIFGSGLNLYLRYIFHDKNDSGSEVLNTRKTNKQKYNDISDFPDIANIPLLYLVVNPTNSLC